MEDNKMMVEEEKNKKERTKEEKKKEEEGKKGRNFFETWAKGWASEMKRNNPRQYLVWFRLNGLGSSQNGKNSLIQNWCIGGGTGSLKPSVWDPIEWNWMKKWKNLPVWMRKMVLGHQNCTVCGDWWKVHQRSASPHRNNK